MAKGLSFLFNARQGGADHLIKGLSTGADKGPDILHYVWLVEVPGVPNADGLKSYLLTTVYDEDFNAYIGDLVKADVKATGGLFFNNAAKAIDGLQDMVPVIDHLSDFIQFIADHDLTQTNLASQFTQFYPWTVALIHDKLGPHQS